MSHRIDIHVEESSSVKGHFYNAIGGNTCIALSLRHDDGRASDGLNIWAEPERLQDILDVLQGALDDARAELVERQALDEAKTEVAEALEVPA